MNQKVVKIICFAAMGLILAVFLAGNIVAGIFNVAITKFIHGEGVDFSGEGYEQTLEEGNALCKEIGAEGIIMLKNENNALPLAANETNLNVFGWGATEGGFLVAGTGSGFADANEYRERTLLLGSLKEAGYKYNENIISMYESYQEKRQGSSLSGTTTDSMFFRLYEPAISSELLTAAKTFSDTALIVISRIGGEDRDLPKVQYKGKNDSVVTDTSRHYLQLSTEEESLIETVTNNFSKVVVLINSCTYMELGFLDNDKIDAALSVGTLGQTGAVAIGQILKGDVNPSGRTVDAWPYSLKSDPTYANSGAEGTNFFSTDSAKSGDKYVDYVEDIYLGYRYYETAAKDGVIDYAKTVQFPFGYGQSYTEFNWDVVDIKPKKAALEKNDKIEITIHVTNTGTEPGKDVVEVYYSVPYESGKIEKPYLQLGAFAKTGELKPGELQEVKLSFDVYDMASYDCYDKNGNGFRGYELDPGDYEIRLQTDSHNLKECDDAVTTYKINSNIRYDKDPVTGTEVKNIFTGENAENGVAIDASTTGANIKFLSRSNFTETFPETLKAARPLTPAIQLNGVGKDKVFDVERPTQGDRQGITLTYQDGDKIVMDDSVVLDLGGNYDSETWEVFLNQLTLAEMAELIGRGGYGTIEIKSIGKVKVYDFDGPAGLNTGNQSPQQMSRWTNYPSETVIGATWNAQLAYIFGLAMGKEAADTNVSGWYAPAVNLHRSAFAGRNFEYFSEDPYLSGILGADIVRGAMANGLYCYVKHFVGNETETKRSGLFTWMTEQALREIYLKPFEICVKRGKANAMMTTFNRLGAVWTGGSTGLCTTILREEWGFRGSVITDWTGGGGYMHPDQGLRAGNDLWLTGGGSMPGSFDDQGRTTTGAYVMRRAAHNILYTYCNAYYTAYHHDSSEDRFVAKIGVKQAGKVTPWWILGLVAIDLAVVAGIGVWLYFIQFKPMLLKKKAKDLTETV